MAILLRQTCRLGQTIFTRHFHQNLCNCALFPIIKLPLFTKSPVLKTVCAKWRLSTPCCSLWGYIRIYPFHTSVVRKAPIPAFLWLLAKPFAKFLAILSGRGFRKWWANLPPNKKDVFIQALKRHKYKFIIGTGVLTGISGLYYVTHLEETPLTGRQRFVAFTPQQFKKIVEFEYQMTKEIYADDLLLPNHPSYKQVVRVAQQLIKGNLDIQQIQERDWNVAVIKSDEKNAFVLPNGHIFVFTGMLNAVNNDDQLGFIIGHEMAHAILNHGIEQVSFAEVLDFLIIIVITIIWALLPSDIIALITQWFFNKVVQLMLNLPYSRQLEKEADFIGLQMAAKACFDVREGSAFWAKMHLQSEVSGDPQVEFLSTHPTHENRSHYLDSLIPEAIELRKISKCPSLPSTDPRKLIEIMKKGAVKPPRSKDQPFGVVISLPGAHGSQRG